VLSVKNRQQFNRSGLVETISLQRFKPDTVQERSVDFADYRFLATAIKALIDRYELRLPQWYNTPKV